MYTMDMLKQLSEKEADKILKNLQEENQDLRKVQKKYSRLLAAIDSAYVSVFNQNRFWNKGIGYWEIDDYIQIIGHFVNYIYELRKSAERRRLGFWDYLIKKQEWDSAEVITSIVAEPASGAIRDSAGDEN